MFKWGMKISPIAVALACLSIALAGQTATKDTSALKSEVERLWTQWFIAFDKGDGATMDTLEVPNFVGVGTDGKGAIFKKATSRVGRVKGQPEVESRTLHDTDVRQFGDTAILTGRETTKTHEGNYEAATTIVWVKQNGRWLIASAQWAELSGPKP